jgi:hypothetical protein
VIESLKKKNICLAAEQGIGAPFEFVSETLKTKELCRVLEIYITEDLLIIAKQNCGWTFQYFLNTDSRSYVTLSKFYSRL